MGWGGRESRSDDHWGFADGDFVSDGHLGELGKEPSSELINLDAEFGADPLIQTAGRSWNVIVAKPIRAFLAFPITGMDQTRSNHVESLNREIVQEIDRCLSPAFEWYLPGGDLRAGKINEGDVYANDLGHLAACDLVIANGCFPAEGVALIVHHAAMLQIPTVIMLPDRTLTPMIAGLPVVPAIAYASSDGEVGQRVFEAVKDKMPRVNQRRVARNRYETSIRDAGVSKLLLASRVVLGRRLDANGELNPAFLHFVETSPGVLRWLPPELMALIGDIYGVQGFVVSSTGLQLKQAPGDNIRELPNYDNLIDLVSLYLDWRRGHGYSSKFDNALILAWKMYAEEVAAAKTRRKNESVGRPDWRRRLESFASGFGGSDGKLEIP